MYFRLRGCFRTTKTDATNTSPEEPDPRLKIVSSGSTGWVSAGNETRFLAQHK